MVHILRLHNKPFYSIKNKTKIIEMRLYDEKRQLLKIGDNIKFINRANEEELYVLIEDLIRFDNFEQVYSSFNKIELGYEENEVAKPSDMEEFYSKEEQLKYGVLAIKIKVI